MSLPIYEEAKKCTNCVDWHKHCQAECCKVISLRLGSRHKPSNIQKGRLFRMNIGPMSLDLQNYFRLHGFNIRRGMIETRLDKFEYDVEKHHILIYQTCKLLDEKGLCKGHFDGRKPEVCKGLDDRQLLNPQYYITPNCAFKYRKQALQKGDKLTPWTL